MLTLLVYFINASVLAYFSVKIYQKIQAKYSPYMAYFFGTAAFYSLGLFIYTILILLSIYTKNNIYLYWSDFAGRIFLYIGSLFAIQISLYHFWPKNEKRFLASIFLAVLGILLAIYNLVVPNYPYIDKLQIIHWQASTYLGLGLAVMLLGVWLPASIIFLTQFVKSKFTSFKALLLGTGFLIGCVSGVLQDFAFSTTQYLVVNLSLAFGFILIFAGLFYDEV